MSNASSRSEGSSRRWRKWIAAAVLLAFFAYLMREVVNPYRDQRFGEIPHGDHVHYVPKDRDREVSISRFPTQKPGPNEMITPEGEVVPRADTAEAPS